MKNRIFAIVLGISPQILFENIYSIYNEDDFPDQIHVYTTKQGEEKLNEYINYLKNDLANIDIITNKILHSLEITIEKSGIENLQNDVINFLNKIYSQNPIEVHLSIAGGRKYNTALMSMAFTLYARDNDKLSHVIVTKEIEAFGNRFIPWRDYNSEAVRLITIPIIKIGKLNSIQNNSLNKVIDEIQSQIDNKSISFITNIPALLVGGNMIQIQPMLAAFLLCLCDKSDMDTGVSRNLFKSECLKKNYLKLGYKRAMPKWQEYISPERVEEMVSRINKLVEGGIANLGSARLIISTGKRSKTEYFINRENFSIDIVW